jgi:hypothetical protein
MAHPLTGLLIAGYIDGAYRVALVEHVRFPRKGSPHPRVHVRLHGGSDTLVEASTWADVLARYRGPRFMVEVTAIKQVLPGDGEAWVDADTYFDWAEGA